MDMHHPYFVCKWLRIQHFHFFQRVSFQLRCSMLMMLSSRLWFWRRNSFAAACISSRELASLLPLVSSSLGGRALLKTMIENNKVQEQRFQYRSGDSNEWCGLRQFYRGHKVGSTILVKYYRSTWYPKLVGLTRDLSVFLVVRDFSHQRQALFRGVLATKKESSCEVISYMFMHYSGHVIICPSTLRLGVFVEVCGPRIHEPLKSGNRSPLTK